MVWLDVGCSSEPNGQTDLDTGSTGSTGAGASGTSSPVTGDGGDDADAETSATDGGPDATEPRIGPMLGDLPELITPDCALASSSEGLAVNSDGDAFVRSLTASPGFQVCSADGGLGFIDGNERYPFATTLTVATDASDNIYSLTSDYGLLRLRKHDPAGAVLWETSEIYGSTGPHAMAVTPAGIVYVHGPVRSDRGGPSTRTVARFEANGMLDWTVDYDLDDPVAEGMLSDIDVDDAGNAYTLSGELVRKIGDDGTVIWVRDLFDVLDVYKLPASIQVTPDGDSVFVSGWIGFASGFPLRPGDERGTEIPDGPFLARLDGEGEVIWVRRGESQKAELDDGEWRVTHLQPLFPHSPGWRNFRIVVGEDRVYMLGQSIIVAAGQLLDSPIFVSTIAFDGEQESVRLFLGVSPTSGETEETLDLDIELAGGRLHLLAAQATAQLVYRLDAP